MRHGEPALPELPAVVTSREFLRGLELYKACGIRAASQPGHATRQMFQQFPAIVTSDLKRAVESATCFAPYESLLIDTDFREIEDNFFQLPLLKLAPRSWSTLFILLWLVGAFRFKKAFREGRAMAQQCANKLQKLAQQHGRVLLVGHGFMNSYIAQALIAAGWSGPRLPAKHYWDYAAYIKAE